MIDVLFEVIKKVYVVQYSIVLKKVYLLKKCPLKLKKVSFNLNYEKSALFKKCCYKKLKKCAVYLIIL